MSFDRGSHELAKQFLGDVPILNEPHFIDRLAQSIQDTIEDFIASEAKEETNRLAEPPYDTLEEKAGLV